MKKLLILLTLIAGNCLYADCPDVLDHDIRLLDSLETLNLCQYEDKVILAVNVASRCGFTYQYESLQELYEKYEEKDFVILGFPSRDFLFQEYSDESAVKEFCNTEYGVTFPLFATSSVKGRKANSFFKALTEESGVKPGWNFHKYLISKNGKVTSFDTKVEPDSETLTKEISKLL
jgi:glutathione peroxidase